MASSASAAKTNRPLMYGLLATQPLTNWVIRGGLPSLIQFIVTEYGFADAQKVALLGAFYPGYLLTQLPAGMLIQKIGAKVTLTGNMLGTAACAALVPLALRTGAPITAASVMMTIMGMFQGSLIPGHQTMKRDWLPTGAGRATVTRICGLALPLNFIMATTLTPYLAARLGWRRVFHIYAACIAAYGALWHALATDSPLAEEASPSAAAMSTAPGAPSHRR